jgi:ABC-type uncharacterized transport system permease subunit
MQTPTCSTPPSLRARAVQGKHAKGARRDVSPGSRARRILVTSLVVGGVAAGSAAAFEYAAAPGHVTTHHQVAGRTNHSPWMY